jgi:hypothetical protein
LVVVRLHREALGAGGPRRKRARLELHVVVGELSRRVAVLLVTDHVGEMLDERPATRDVQQLHTAADGEQGEVSRERAVGQGELEAITLRHGLTDLGMRPGAVGGRIDVGASGEDQRVQPTEQLVGRLGGGVIRRQEDREPAGILHRAHVGPGRHRDHLVPGTPPHALERRADTDDRPEHATKVYTAAHSRHEPREAWRGQRASAPITSCHQARAASSLSSASRRRAYRWSCEAPPTARSGPLTA